MKATAQNGLPQFGLKAAQPGLKSAQPATKSKRTTTPKKTTTKKKTVTKKSTTKLPTYDNPNYKVTKEVFENTFATCVLQPTGKNKVDGTIRLFQQPYYAVSVKADLTGLTANSGYRATITKFGDITDDCQNMGPEYESLYEFNEIYDPYGRFVGAEVVTDGMIDELVADDKGVCAYKQQDLMQNLGGEKNLIGRGIRLTANGSEDALACCAIGLDVAPTK